jgi:hypothetical protein
MGRISYYVSAHQDDWQLFRGEQAATDVARPDSRVIFIYVTAGELDHALSGIPQDVIWPAREHGAMASIEALTGERSQPATFLDIGGHRIARYVCANTVSYFLRIREQLYKLRHGYERTWPAIDGSSSYTWRSLVETLRALVDHERGDVDEPPWVNTHAGDHQANGPQGSGDHWAVAAAVEAAVLDGSYRLLGWIDYHVEDLDPNLSAKDAELKRVLMRDAYSRVYAHDAGIDDWKLARSFYEGWIDKSYFATAEGPRPSR